MDKYNNLFDFEEINQFQILKGQKKKNRLFEDNEKRYYVMIFLRYKLAKII